MRIKYLGTGAAEGWPAVFCHCEPCKEARRLGGRNIRRRSSALLDGKLLFDLPPDIFGQSLLLGVDLTGIREFLITHAHEDHFYPNELTNVAEPFAHIPGGVTLRLHGSSTVIGIAEAAVAENSPGSRLQLVEAKAFQPFDADGYTVTPLPANHGAGVSFIYLVRQGEKALLYAHDTGWPHAEVWDFLKDVRLSLVSMDGTCLEAAHYDSHMTLDENIAMKQKLITMGCADGSTVFVSSHFSHNGLLLHHEIEQRLAPHGILTAYDGMEVDF